MLQKVQAAIYTTCAGIVYLCHNSTQPAQYTTSITCEPATASLSYMCDCRAATATRSTLMTWDSVVVIQLNQISEHGQDYTCMYNYYTITEKLSLSSVVLLQLTTVAN